jgi:8-oxo-dGTP diphosphatase
MNMQKTLTCIDVNGAKHKVPVTEISWLPGAYAIVIHDGKILLSRQHGKNRYVLPGGGPELGEMPWDAAVRETAEETGIQVANPRLLACKSNMFIMPGIDKPVQSVQLFYQCDFVGGEPSIAGLDEHEVVWSSMPEWVSLDKLEDVENGSSFEWFDVVYEAMTRNETAEKHL